MKYTFLFLLLFTSGLAFAQPSLRWQKCFGGKSNEFPGGMIQTRDGGYIMAAQTKSSEGDVTFNHGNYDLWVIKMDSKFSIEWQKTYGGSRDEGAGAILQTPDGGYIIAASTNSNDGDLTGIFHGDSTYSDVWVLKIDDKGTILWQKTYGGSKNDFSYSIIEVNEGSYLISATTQSDDGNVLGFHGKTDAWIFQINSAGIFQWQKTFGGSGYDDLYSLIQTYDGGFALCGYTYSNDGDVSGRHRDTTSEIWLVKLANNGGLQWQKTYGGSGYEEGYSLVQTPDHGFVIAGNTSSNDGDVSGLHGTYFSDCWIFKVDSTGILQWQKTYGGSHGDAATSLQQTSDSGFIVSGDVASDDGDVTNFHGTSDCWLFKISSSGKLLWQKTLGGTGSDANIGSGIMPLSDTDFLVITVTSSVDGDVSGRRGDSSADGDIWFVRLSSETNGVESSSIIKNANICLYPNPSSGKGNISYDLEKLSFVTIKIFDQLGAEVRTLISGNEDAGNQKHVFDISDLSSGRYFFRIDLEAKVVTYMLELIK